MGQHLPHHSATRTFATALAVTGLCLTGLSGCSSLAEAPKENGSAATVSENTAKPARPEPKSAEVRSAEPKVQSEIGKMAARKRAELLKDAQAALDETRNVLQELNKGDTQKALGALERVTGKLDLIVARDPHLALAPVGVVTTIHDLLASPIQ